MLVAAGVLLSSCVVSKKKFETAEAGRLAALYSRDSLADLNPHPFLSAIGDSHPTLGERIQVVRSAQEKRGERGSKSDAS